MQNASLVKKIYFPRAVLPFSVAAAVAVHVDPEILLIDEVLAVEDLAFQEKCLATLLLPMRQSRWRNSTRRCSRTGGR